MDTETQLNAIPCLKTASPSCVSANPPFLFKVELPLFPAVSAVWSSRELFCLVLHHF